MVLTIEPGVYMEDKFGVRIESVGIVTRHSEHRDFCFFDVVTRVPISPKLVDASLLTAEEAEWLDNYNKQCFDALAPFLQDPEDAAALRYLVEECRPLRTAN